MVYPAAIVQDGILYIRGNYGPLNYQDFRPVKTDHVIKQVKFLHTRIFYISIVDELYYLNDDLKSIRILPTEKVRDLDKDLDAGYRAVDRNDDYLHVVTLGGDLIHIKNLEKDEMVKLNVGQLSSVKFTQVRVSEKTMMALDTFGNLWCDLNGYKKYFSYTTNKISSENYIFQVTYGITFRHLSLFYECYHLIDDDGILYVGGKHRKHLLIKMHKGKEDDDDKLPIVPLTKLNCFGLEFRTTSIGYQYVSLIDINNNLWITHCGTDNQNTLHIIMKNIRQCLAYYLDEIYALTNDGQLYNIEYFYETRQSSAKETITFLDQEASSLSNQYPLI